MKSLFIFSVLMLSATSSFANCNISNLSVLADKKETASIVKEALIQKGYGFDEKSEGLNFAIGMQTNYAGGADEQIQGDVQMQGFNVGVVIGNAARRVTNAVTSIGNDRVKGKESLLVIETSEKVLFSHSKNISLVSDSDMVTKSLIKRIPDCSELIQE